MKNALERRRAVPSSTDPQDSTLSARSRGRQRDLTLADFPALPSPKLPLNSSSGPSHSNPPLDPPPHIEDMPGTSFMIDLVEEIDADASRTTDRVLYCAFDARVIYGELATKAQELKAALRSKEAELDQLTAPHERELSFY
jgi:hypothetical protein